MNIRVCVYNGIYAYEIKYRRCRNIFMKNGRKKGQAVFRCCLFKYVFF